MQAMVCGKSFAESLSGSTLTIILSSLDGVTNNFKPLPLRLT